MVLFNQQYTVGIDTCVVVFTFGVLIVNSQEILEGTRRPCPPVGGSNQLFA